MTKKEKESEILMNEDMKSLSFEDAAAQLEKIIHQLEDGKVSLDESVQIYSRGVLLKNHCEMKLRDATAKVEKILIQKDGTPIIEPFDEMPK